MKFLGMDTSFYKFFQGQMQDLNLGIDMSVPSCSSITNIENVADG